MKNGGVFCFLDIGADLPFAGREGLRDGKESEIFGTKVKWKGAEITVW
jgi:hypothetical protein